jgi:cobalt-zinc-cadmium efflux system membrane fusion protein
MNAQSYVNLRRSVLVASALACVVLGAGAAYLWSRWDTPGRSLSEIDVMGGMADMAGESRVTEGPSGAEAARADVAVTLDAETIARAGITETPVVADRMPTSLRVPGVVEANAYRRVVVTPIAGGRVTGVTVELGQQVRQGQTMAQVFSADVADARTRYVSVRADLAAHELEVARTEQLATIGAASRQEVERAHADHAAHVASLESAASRLQLFGLSVEEIEGLGSGADGVTIDVPAPLTGVVTERLANVGLNVDPTTPLFTVVDLSSVWIVVEVYEVDFPSVRVGRPATVTIQAYPGRVLHGRVSYIDPQVNPATRTAQARIEVANQDKELRLGMFAEAVLEGEPGSVTPVIPTAAVQHVGNRTVVYLVDSSRERTFLEREVLLGGTRGDRVAVLSGVETGDVVVAGGSFALRAERERLGPRATAGDPVPSGAVTVE